MTDYQNQIGTTNKKASDLYSFCSSKGVKLTDVVTRASEKVQELNPEADPISYKGTVNRLAKARDGKDVSISDETMDLLHESAIELAEEKLQPIG